jgi:hypothetical protein
VKPDESGHPGGRRFPGPADSDHFSRHRPVRRDSGRQQREDAIDRRRFDQVMIEAGAP